MAERYSEAELAVAQSTPAWATGAFAIAVFAGLIGALALLARKGWSRLMFIVSLVAVVIQHVWTFFLSGYLDIMPATAAIGPIVVIVVGIFEVWYSGNGIRRGWLR